MLLDSPSFLNGTKKREKLTLVLKRDAAVFVIRNVHHSKFKLCNSNLEDPSAILLLPFIRPNSDEKKSFFIDFPAGGVGGGGKMKEISSNEAILSRKSNLAMNVKESEMIADGFWACRDHSTSDREKKAKVFMNKFRIKSEKCTSGFKSLLPRPSVTPVFAAPRLQIRWTELAKIDILCNKLVWMLLACERTSAEAAMRENLFGSHLRKQQ